MNELLDRLKQESTWRGLVAIIAGFGIQIAPDMQGAIVTLALAIVGLINVAKKD